MSAQNVPMYPVSQSAHPAGEPIPPTPPPHDEPAAGTLAHHQNTGGLAKPSEGQTRYDAQPSQREDRTSAIPVPETPSKGPRLEPEHAAVTTALPSDLTRQDKQGLPPPTPPKGSQNSNIRQQTPQTPSSTSDADPPKPDLVLTFNLPKRDAPEDQWGSAEQEYKHLINVLEKEGILITARAGEQNSNTRLVFLKGTQAAVRAEAQKERLGDWLRSVRAGASREDLDSPRDFQSDPLSPAERIRHVASIVERAFDQTPFNKNVTGISSFKTEKPFPRVEAYFPLHDESFNQRWLRAWSQVKIFIPESQLMDIRDHFGDGVALYFEFLRYYFRALAFPAFIGLVTWLGGHNYSKLYSFMIVAWSMVALEGWKVRERKLSVRWGTYGLSQNDTSLRIGFRPEEYVTSPMTGEKIPHAPWWRRELKVLASVPAVFGFALLLSILICIIFSFEVIIGEAYDGPGKQLLSLLPIVGYAGVVPQVVGYWHQLARQLTDWENHPTRRGHERAQTLKMFVLNAIVSYGVLTLTAYVYLPFASFVVPYIISVIRHSPSVNSGSTQAFHGETRFSGSPARLTNTLFALMTTTQAIGAFTEVALPYLQRKLMKQYEAMSEKKDSSSNKTLSRSEKWLNDVREQSQRPGLELFAEYAEMVIQFGHVVLFSTAWPLAPVAALVNNFFELRGDAFKLCKNMRRPVPKRADSIGPWLDTLSFISYLGALTNGSLVYLLRTQNVPVTFSGVKGSIQEVMQAVGNATHIKTLPAPSLDTHFVTTRVQQAQGDYSSVLNTLLGALLCALASEHGYLAVKMAFSKLLDKLIWQGSEEELHVRGMNWQIRKDYVSSKGGQNFEKEISRLSHRREQDYKDAKSGSEKQANLVNIAFWREQDAGVRQEINKKTQ